MSNTITPSYLFRFVLSPKRSRGPTFGAAGPDGAQVPVRCCGHLRQFPPPNPEPCFEPLQRQVELWRKTQVTDDQATLIFYSALIDGKSEAPRSLLPNVHQLYFEPEYPEFSARTMWSLSNAFTSAFKKLDPIPQFKATAKLGEFLAQLPA